MSIAAHAVVVLLLIIGMSVRPTPVDTKAPPIKLNAVYIPIAGPQRGGGGHRGPASAKDHEVPRHELPKPAPVDPQPVRPEPPRDPLPTIDVAIETDAAKMLRAAGVGPVSLDPGGGGRGRTAGSGVDDGLGPGSRGRSGGGDRGVGNDVTQPRLIKSVDPTYTPEADTEAVRQR